MTDDWTIEKELNRLSGQSNILDSAVALKLVAADTRSIRITTDTKWERGGAETYVYRLWIGPEKGELRGCIIKACLAMDIGAGVSGTVKKWVARRALLRQQGVSTPHLYFAGEGVILEELIPKSLREVLQSDPSRIQVLLPSILHLIEAVVGLGFHPIALTSDLRSSGRDVVMVDFGQDLGEAGVGSGGAARIFDEFSACLREWGVPVSQEMRDAIVRSRHGLITHH